MAPFVILVLSLGTLYLTVTGRLEAVWDALKKGKK